MAVSSSRRALLSCSRTSGEPFMADKMSQGSYEVKRQRRDSEKRIHHREHGEQTAEESATELRNQPEEKGERDADHDCGSDRKIEGGVFAAVDDVAGKAAEAEREFAGEKQERACGGQDEAEDQEDTTQLAEFHRNESRPVSGWNGSNK